MSGSYDAAGRAAEGAAAKQGAAAESVGVKSQAAADKTTAASDRANKSVTRFGNWGAAAVIGFAAGAVDLGLKYQQATTQIAKSADISTEKASQIGNAVLDTAGKTEFSAQQQAVAYAKVAGQLGLVEGHALNTGQAMDVVNAASVLAEASNTDLGTAMSQTAKVMQAYQVSAEHASDVTTVLQNTSRLTGQSINNVAMTVARLKTQMGVLAPPIGQTSALLVDLTAHGETGRGAISSLNSALTTLTKPLTGVAIAQDQANTAFKALPPNLQAVALQYERGQISSTQFANVVKTLPPDVAKLATSFIGAQGKIESARQALKALPITVADAKGNFVGLQSVIAQLQPQLAGLTETQQLAKLQEVFGAGASRKLLEVVLAGPAAFAKYQKAVENKSAAEQAAAKQAATLKTQMETVKATAEDLGTKLGTALIPKFELLAHELTTGVVWLEKHKDAAKALAVMVGVTLTAAVAVFTEQKLVRLATGLRGIVTDIGKVTSALGSAITKVNEWGSANEKATTKVEAQGAATEAAATKVEAGAPGAAGAAGSIGPAGAAGATGAGAAETGATALDTAAANLDGAAGRLATSATDLGDSATALTDAATKMLETDQTAASLDQTDAADTQAAASELTSSAAELSDAAVAQAGTGVLGGAKAAVNLGEKGLVGAGELALAKKATSALPDLRAAEPGLLGAAGGGGLKALLGKLPGFTGEGVLGTGLTGSAAALAGVMAPLAGYQAYNMTGNFLREKSGLGHTVGSGITAGASGVANLFGVGPEQAGQARVKADLGPASIKALEAVALGLSGPTKTGLGTSAGAARGALHEAGVSDKQIADSKGAVEKTLSPATKQLDIVANNFKIAGDKNSLWVAMAQAATDKQEGVSDKSAKAAEKSLQANIAQLTGANILLYASNQSRSAADVHKTAANTHQKAADKQLSVADMQHKAADASRKASGDVSTASSDLQKAAQAQVDGNKKAADDLQKKASHLDTAATDLDKAAQMWQSGALLALSDPSRRGSTTPAMNPPNAPSPAKGKAPKTAAGGVTTGESERTVGEAGAEAIIPLESSTGTEALSKAMTRAASTAGQGSPRHHAEGGVAYGPTIFGEAGKEAVLPLTSPTAMGDIASAITQAMGESGGISGSHQTIYQIQELVIVAQNPAEMEQQLAQRARVGALSGRPSPGTNLAVAS
jgi:TP901 family phage tail tape measure protein